METINSITTIFHDQPIGTFTLHVGTVKQLKQSGWRGVSLYLKDKKGNQSLRPVVEGIYSVGGKGIEPWFDCTYHEILRLGGKEISLHEHGLDRILFKKLSRLIPPGGHLMVSYEKDYPILLETHKELDLHIPPCATPLGFLLFSSGFQYIKDWYLAEGGMEGPRKLWAEKAPDEYWAKMLMEKTETQIRRFILRGVSFNHKESGQTAFKRANEIIRSIKASLYSYSW